MGGRKMMGDGATSVSISSFLVSMTFLSWINTEVTQAQKIPDSMLDDILGDIVSQYQDADYGSFNYNDIVPENPPPLFKATAEPRSLKQTHNSKGPMKNSMLPAYCDPPNTVCATQSICSPVQTKHYPTSTRSSRRTTWPTSGSPVWKMLVTPSYPGQSCPLLPRREWIFKIKNCIYKSWFKI